MKIGIDIDNVISDTYPLFIHKFNATFGKNFRYEEITDFYYLEKQSDVVGVDKVTIARFIDEMLFDASFQMQIPPLPAAQKVIAKWSQKGHAIHYITARPQGMGDHTIKWLKKYHFIVKGASLDLFPQSTHHLDNRQQSILYKKEIVGKKKIDLFIEDSKEIAQSLDIPVLLIDRPWNRGELPKNIRRVKDWNEIDGLINNYQRS